MPMVMDAMVISAAAARAFTAVSVLRFMVLSSRRGPLGLVACLVEGEGYSAHVSPECRFEPLIVSYVSWPPGGCRKRRAGVDCGHGRRGTRDQAGPPRRAEGGRRPHDPADRPAGAAPGNGD